MSSRRAGEQQADAWNFEPHLWLFSCLPLISKNNNKGSYCLKFKDVLGTVCAPA